ncbi:MAG: hypothetical protein ACO1QS_16555 [Verrucomicrobiota bacterium]
MIGLLNIPFVVQSATGGSPASGSFSPDDGGFFVGVAITVTFVGALSAQLEERVGGGAWSIVAGGITSPYNYNMTDAPGSTKELRVVFAGHEFTSGVYTFFP